MNLITTNQKSGRSIITILTCGLLAWTCISSQANSAVVLDQAYVPPTPPPAVTGFGAGEYAAQTFTVGVAGTLDHVDVLMHESSTGSGDLAIDIRPTSGGVPVENNALVLASGSIASASFPQFPPDQSFAWVSLDVSAANIYVMPGEVLAISMTPASSDGAFGWAGSSFSGYVRGQTFAREPASSWEVNPPSDLIPGFTYGFKTYVNTPEPSTIVSGAIAGLCVLAGTLARRRRLAI